MPFGPGITKSPSYRPMGNAFDRRRQFLPEEEEQGQAGLYTTNTTGSQTAGSAISPVEVSSPIIQNQNDAIRRAQRVLGQTTTTLDQVYNLAGGAAARRAEFDRLNEEDAKMQAAAMQQFQLSQARQNQQAQNSLRMDELSQRADAVLGSQGFTDGQAGAVAGSPLARLIAASKNKKANEDFAQSPGHSLGRLYGPNGGVETPPEVDSNHRVMPNPDWYPGHPTEQKWITYGPSANRKSVEEMRYDARKKTEQRRERNRMLRFDADGNQLDPGDSGYDDGYEVSVGTVTDGRLHSVLPGKIKKRQREDAQREANGGFTDREMERIQRKRVRLQKKQKKGLITQQDVEAGVASAARTSKSQMDRFSRPPKRNGGHTLPDGRPDVETDKAITADAEAMKDDENHQSQVKAMGIKDSSDLNEIADAFTEPKNRQYFNSSSVSDEAKYDTGREMLRAFRAAYKESPRLAKNKLGFVSGATMDEALFIDVDNQDAVMDWVDKMLSDTSSEHRKQYSRNLQRRTQHMVPRLGY